MSKTDFNAFEVLRILQELRELIEIDGWLRGLILHLSVIELRLEARGSLLIGTILRRRVEVFEVFA
jgi:hypothetical protein